jgi:hypothetical protein
VNIVKIIIMGATVAAIATACATTAKSSGSNSNWLETCASDSDCSAGLECWCGICTKPCSAASDCSAFSAGASCDPTLATAICGTPTFTASCALACVDDSDCSELGADGRCIEGACRKVTGTTLSDAGALTCPALNNAIQKSYSDALAASAAAAPCKNDADCVQAPTPQCGPPGCGGAYTSSAGAAVVQSRLPQLEHEFCDSYFAAGCSQPGFPGCPYLGPPLCIQGTCTACSLGFCSPPPTDAGTESQGDAGRMPVTCQDRTKQISDDILSNTALKDDSCASDADCTTAAIDMRCYHSCDSPPLSVAAAQAVATSLQTLEANLCPAFEAAGCTSPVPPCVPPMPVKCSANVCVTTQP